MPHTDEARLNPPQETATMDTHIEAAILELAPEIATPRSVVAPSYKRRYAERALTARKPKDVSRKAAARCSGDWLAFTIAKLCLREKDAFSVSAFEAILDANGVAHQHWNRTTKGWQGRLRMTGRLALQRIVAEGGELELADGTIVVAPKVWVAKFNHAA